MKTEYIKCCGRMLLVFVLCAFLITGTAFAAEQDGTLRISLENEEGCPMEAAAVEILRVADSSGRLTADFAETGLTVEHLTQERYSRASSETLLNFARVQKMNPQTAETGRDGKASFDALEEGVYVVFCAEGQTLNFEPFLISVPNGSGTWSVDANPKTEEAPEENPEDKPENPLAPEIEPPEEPEIPESPGQLNPKPEGGSEKPKIPQTGSNYWFVWILTGAGILLCGCGVWCLRSERKGGNE